MEVSEPASEIELTHVADAPATRLLSGQLGDDGSKFLGEVGADNEIGEADLGICTNVTVSAISAASARAFGLRTAIATGV